MRHLAYLETSNIGRAQAWWGMGFTKLAGRASVAIPTEDTNEEAAALFAKTFSAEPVAQRQGATAVDVDATSEPRRDHITTVDVSWDNVRHR